MSEAPKPDYATEFEARVAMRLGQLSLALISAETARDIAQAQARALGAEKAALAKQVEELTTKG